MKLTPDSFSLARLFLPLSIVSLLLVLSMPEAFCQDTKVHIKGGWPTVGDSVYLPVILENPNHHQFDEFMLNIQMYERKPPLLPPVQDVIPVPRETDCGWEYFYHQIDDTQITIYGKVDTSEGRNCLIDNSVVLAHLFIVVPLDLEYVEFATWFGFTWSDCSDNTFLATSSDTAFYSDSVYYPWSDTLAGPGTDDSCLITPPPGTTVGVRKVLFENSFLAGGIADDIGDVNLDGLTHTIADFVMMNNYFLKGEAAFPSRPRYQGF